MNDNAKWRGEVVERVREFHRRLSAWAQAVWGRRAEENFEESETYQQALGYYRQFRQKEGADYSGVIAYAQRLYEHYDKVDKSLDEKADSVIKYLGGGSALITFGALLSVKVDTALSCVLAAVVLACLLPSLGLAVLAVWKATHVRRPRAAAALPPAKFAVEMAEHYPTKEEFELNLWLILYPLSEAAHHRNQCKSELLEAAHRYYRWAIAGLGIPVVGIIACLIAFAVKLSKP